MKKINKGFTLIELMFVIIIFAVVGFYSITKQRNKTRQEAIENTVIEMKNILSANLAYYIKNNGWPLDESQLWTLGSSSTQQTFLNQTAFCSPWPRTSGSYALNVCSSKAAYQGLPGGAQPSTASLYYTVSVDVPTESIAKQIAARLPNSEVVAGNTVQTSVTIPGELKGFLYSAGITYMDNTDLGDKKIHLPICPSGYEGHIVFTPQNQVWGFDSQLEVGGGSLEGPTDNHYYVSAYNNLHDDSTKYYSSYYLTFCLLAGNWRVNSDDVSGSGDNAQCDSGEQADSAWGTYNAPYGQCRALNYGVS